MTVSVNTPMVLLHNVRCKRSREYWGNDVICYLHIWCVLDSFIFVTRYKRSVVWFYNFRELMGWHTLYSVVFAKATMWDIVTTIKTNNHEAIISRIIYEPCFRINGLTTNSSYFETRWQCVRSLNILIYFISFLVMNEFR